MAGKTNMFDMGNVIGKMGKPLVVTVSAVAAFGALIPGAGSLLSLLGGFGGNILSNQIENLPQILQNFLHRKGRVNHDL